MKKKPDIAKRKALLKIIEETKKDSMPSSSKTKAVDGFVRLINALLKKNRLKAVCVKGGSFAKDTFLEGDFDVDLFVQFDKKYDDSRLSDLLGKALKPLKPERIHGSRDYFQVKKEMMFEIVPVLKIKKPEEAVNVTDASPLHVIYVNARLAKKPGLKNDIRIAKLFCKSAKVYGAESYIQGLSGHVIDILIIFYGSFEKLIVAASKWKDKTVIDVEKQLDDPLFYLNKSKTLSPLVVVDPIQKERNAAAAVSEKKYRLFIEKCRDFLKRPSREYFTIKKLEKSSISFDSKKQELFFFEIEPLKGKKDVVGAKIMKAYDCVLSMLKNHDFGVADSGYEFSAGKGVMYFVVKKVLLSEKMPVTGPYSDSTKEHIAAFRRKHRQVLMKNRRYYAMAKRQYRTAGELLADAVKSRYVLERVKKVRLS